ncbi:hypothetical protein R1flu_000870 [Riccia fluitans]|uniref:F-box protein n=1 Tax=Riccia fluitans TaxID=41844 RepID=A0ABD1Y1P8_9MARC
MKIRVRRTHIVPVLKWIPLLKWCRKGRCKVLIIGRERWRFPRPEDGGGMDESNAWRESLGYFLDKLPVELTEKIVSQVPFSEIFRYRAPWERWPSKFVKSLLSPFLIRKSAPCWPSFSPAFVLDRRKLIAFNRLDSCWEYFHFEAFPSNASPHGSDPVFGGALVCILEEGPIAVVTNLLTRNRRRISCPPELGNGHFFSPLIVPVGAENYKLIFYGIKGEDTISALFEVYLYDSGCRVWMYRSAPAFEISRISPCAYLDGILYGMWPCSQSSSFTYLFQFDLQNGVLRETHGMEFEEDRFVKSGVVVCGSRVMVVIIESDPHTFVCDGARVFEMNTENGFVEGDRSPPCELVGNVKSKQGGGTMLTSDENCIYFCDHDTFIIYYVQSGVWISQHYPPFTQPLPLEYNELCMRGQQPLTFQPGLNPSARP